MCRIISTSDFGFNTGYDFYDHESDGIVFDRSEDQLIESTVPSRPSRRKPPAVIEYPTLNLDDLGDSCMGEP